MIRPLLKLSLCFCSVSGCKFGNQISDASLSDFYCYASSTLPGGATCLIIPLVAATCPQQFNCLVYFLKPKGISTDLLML